jgi:hypothetical protein
VTPGVGLYCQIYFNTVDSIILSESLSALLLSISIIISIIVSVIIHISFSNFPALLSALLSLRSIAASARHCSLTYDRV